MLVIKSDNVFSATDSDLSGKYIVVDHGKIKEILEECPDNADLLDLGERFLMPGIVDAHSHIGGFGSTFEDQDLNEMTNATTPEMEALFGIDIYSDDYKRALKNGVTTSAIAPGSGNVVGGVACVIKSYGKGLEDRVLKNPVALKAAMGGNPKGVYGKRNQAPMTRMGIAQLLREQLIKAVEYKNKENRDFDFGMENFLKVLNKEIPLKVHSAQFDMMTVIEIAKEFDVEFTLEHAWGASDFYDDIMNSNCVGVVYGPIGVPLLPGECGKIDIYSLIELDNRGMLCAIMSDGPIISPEIIRIQAGEVVRFGGDPNRVLKMITSNPSKILGVDDRVGSIEVGKDADFVVFSENPVTKPGARVECTISNGDIVYQSV